VERVSVPHTDQLFARGKGDRPRTEVGGWRRAETAASDALAAQFRKVEVPEADAAHRAALIIAVEGAVLIARAQRSTEPLLLVAEQFTNPQA
jgi:hypothetical protein